MAMAMAMAMTIDIALDHGLRNPEATPSHKYYADGFNLLFKNMNKSPHCTMPNHS
jgi:hypothetical protein